MKIEQYNNELFAQYTMYVIYLKNNNADFEEIVGKSHLLQADILNWVLDSG